MCGTGDCYPEVANELLFLFLKNLNQNFPGMFAHQGEEMESLVNFTGFQSSKHQERKTAV
jgi:hypothetical protein